ncbi:cupredoxin domain-containing protein [Alienimonas californiensis]|uniref:carboxypeptidase regulatory-like domain-containing protein n=1 Tax=Alienimonas californiensis TaxID=2527989 RepID=UPI001A99F44F|nr:carboxypeptidase regulatory-like domain-containing protein [Alienimonas californiensis]
MPRGAAEEPPAGGALRGRLLFGGPPPQPERVEVNKDVDVCGPLQLEDDTLLVAEDGGLANAVIWLDVRSSGREPAASALEKGAEAVVLDNVDCRFEPHVVLLRTGQTLKITNSDPIAHQATAFLNRNIPFNESVPAGSPPVERTLEKPELLPLPVTCPIHPWMKAHLFVLDHPYMTATGPDGRFAIRGLPPGEWTFRLWHEKAGFLKGEEVQGDAPAGWDGAKLTVTVTEGGTVDLGEVKLQPAAFE